MKTKTNHLLIIDSPHDVQAHCSCRKWTYTTTGPINDSVQARIAWEHKQHKTYAEKVEVQS